MSAVPRPLLGWPLLPLPDEQGRIDWPNLETSVAELIQVILKTWPGEQLMRPEFGAGLERLLHEPNTLATRRRIRDCIEQGLTRWERRIVLDRIEVHEAPDQPAHVLVEIAYRLARTGTPVNLGLTIRLEG